VFDPGSVAVHHGSTTGKSDRRPDKLISAWVQWAEKIMERIDELCGKG
jgi:hypothetical protein